MAQNIEGNAYVKFVVTQTGEVGKVKILRSSHELLSREAIHVVKITSKI